MAIQPRRAMPVPVAPLAGAGLSIVVFLLGLVLWRQEVPAAEPGFFSKPVALLALVPVIATGYIAGILLRGSTPGLRMVVSVAGGVAAAGIGLLLAGLGEPGQTAPADLVWPGSMLGRAGLWLMAVALGPVAAAWAIEYRRNDPWYVIPVGLALLGWLIPLGAALMLLPEL